MAESFDWNRYGQAADTLPQPSDSTAAAAPMTTDEKLALMGRNLQEVCKKELMRKVLDEEKRDIKIYWGTATTGRPHIAYFVPMSKIADFLRAGCEVTILFADVHACLDNLKSNWDEIKFRTVYYRECICGILESIGVKLDKLKFVIGSDYQLSREFTMDILRLVSICSQHDAQKAGAEVVKQTESPPLSGLLYPVYQWLDEEYLHVDAQFGGVDQRKIFMSAEKYLPKIGYKARAHLMNPMVPGLTGDKMSASDPDSKIDLLDDTPVISKKIMKKVFCEEGNIEKNPLLSFVKSVLLLVRSEFKVVVKERGEVCLTDYAEIETLFKDKLIHPKDLKQAVVRDIDALLAPIRKKFETPEMQEVIAKAYTTGKAKAGGKKKAKGKGKGAAAAAAPTNPNLDISRAEIRVGKILSVENHPNADSLFVEKVDLGEEEGPRTVISGLVGKVDREALVNREVVVVCNLKPQSMRSIKSHAMLLCATSADGKTEPLDPPAGCTIGERVTVAEYPGDHDRQLNPKKKIWEAIQPDLAVNADKVATFKGAPLITSKGPVTVASVTGCSIK